jgi:quercetin dioxygenase-like cupin family protein
MAARSVVGLLFAALLASCARAPRVPYAGDLDAFLAAHRLAGGQDIRADELGRTATASYHLVQVRDGEKPHRHVAHDLTILVLRGRGTLTRGEERVALVAGDAAVVPRGEVHWFTRGGHATSVALVVFAPPLDAPDTVPAEVR